MGWRGSVAWAVGHHKAQGMAGWHSYNNMFFNAYNPGLMTTNNVICSRRPITMLDGHPDPTMPDDARRCPTTYRRRPTTPDDARQRPTTPDNARLDRNVVPPPTTPTTPTTARQQPDKPDNKQPRQWPDVPRQPDNKPDVSRQPDGQGSIVPEWRARRQRKA
jgi:hypothetical protein